jgi:phosphomannomutase/phosphoglucomutase
MSPYCADESKYAVVDRVTAHYRALRDRGACIAGRKIADLVTVNGVRVQLDDGSWGLVRASSNKPELVVVCESPVCEATMRAVFTDIDNHLATYSEIGAYNQKI